MAGHSKWHNIKHRKEKQDKKRAKLFSKLSSKITSAAKGNPDPESNVKLRQAIEEAKDKDMPKENIQNAIERAKEGVGGGDNRVEYGILGPDNFPIIVVGNTDNKNRTLGNIRKVLTDKEGEITGLKQVTWQFKKIGIIEIENEDVDELELIEKGAEDIKENDNTIKIYTKPKELGTTKNKIEENYNIKESYMGWKRKNKEEIPDKIKKIINQLKEDPDISKVYPSI